MFALRFDIFPVFFVETMSFPFCKAFLYARFKCESDGKKERTEAEDTRDKSIVVIAADRKISGGRNKGHR